MIQGHCWCILKPFPAFRLHVEITPLQKCEGTHSFFHDKGWKILSRAQHDIIFKFSWFTAFFFLEIIQVFNTWTHGFLIFVKCQYLKLIQIDLQASTEKEKLRWSSRCLNQVLERYLGCLEDHKNSVMGLHSPFMHTFCSSSACAFKPLESRQEIVMYSVLEWPANQTSKKKNQCHLSSRLSRLQQNIAIKLTNLIILTV